MPQLCLLLFVVHTKHCTVLAYTLWNPGPSTEQLLQQLLQKSMQQRFHAIKGKLRTSLAVVKEFREKMTNMERTNQNLERKLVDIEDRGRRNNLIIFGIPENTRETPDSLAESVVDDLFRNKLGLQVQSVERIHRLGTRKSDRPRPTILKLFDHREKIMVLKNCFKLKGSSVSISDFSAATRQLRKHLWNNTADAGRNGKKVRLVHDKVKIDNELFEWNTAEMKIVPLHKHRKASAQPK